MTDATELADEIHAEVVRLSEEGDDLADADNYDEALMRYRAAYALLPEPQDRWDAAFWILTGIGDAQFFKGEYAAALDTFQQAQMAGPLDDPFVHLRLGQCAFEVGDLRRADNGLMGAYMLEGPDIFRTEDPKYLLYLATIAHDIDTTP